MSIHDIKIARHGAGAQFVLAAGQARAIAEKGDVARIYMADDRRAAEAVYVWRSNDHYEVQPATLISADWIERLEHAINQRGTQ